MYKVLYYIGQQLRNPSINKWLKFLKESDGWSREDLEAHQWNEFKKICNLAYQYSPFYKEFWDKSHFHPDMLKCLDDVQKIPILEKAQLLTNAASIHTNRFFKQTYTATTSGSTGDSLQFKRDESADSFNRAAIQRGYSWYQVHPWEFSGYFWGFDFKVWEQFKTRLLDRLQNRYRIFSYNEHSFKKFVKKIEKARYLSGYSSMLYDTAKLINSQQLEKPKQLKLVVGTSEKIFEAYQEEALKAYGSKIISEYGATEAGIIAFECPEGHMHITMEGVLVEEVNKEILVSNLVMQSFPLIRYRLGDYVKLAPKEFSCSCGRNHRIIEEVTGRVGALIQGKGQQYPSLYCYYIFKNLAAKSKLILNYQAIQEEKGKLKLLIEQALTEDEKLLLLKACENYFKKDLEIEIIDSYQAASRNQKVNSFISRIKNET